MAKQKTGSYSTKYRFTGKEIDEETGFYYFGARYYDPRISLWYGVDPLAEKNYSYSPYIYNNCNSNFRFKKSTKLSRTFILLSLIFFVIISYLGFKLSIRDYKIKKNGINLIAEVVSSPRFSRSGGSVRVKINEKVYLLEIGKHANGADYRIGQKVNVLYSDYYDKIISTTSNTTFGLIICFIPIGIIIYLLFKLFQKRRRSSFSKS